MKYETFIAAIVVQDGLKFIDVVACDLTSAIADVKQAYGEDVEISHWKIDC